MQSDLGRSVSDLGALPSKRRFAEVSVSVAAALVNPVTGSIPRGSAAGWKSKYFWTQAAASKRHESMRHRNHATIVASCLKCSTASAIVTGAKLLLTCTSFFPLHAPTLRLRC